MFRRILLGLVIVIGSAMVIYYAPRLVQMFGRNAWAEEHLGGTKNAIVIGSFLLMIIGFLLVFGVIGIVGPVSSIEKQQFVSWF